MTPEQISEFSADELDQLLESLRALGSQLKAVEVAILGEVDRPQIPLGDGMRTVEDWVIGRMDVDRSTARNLVAVAEADCPSMRCRSIGFRSSPSRDRPTLRSST